MEIRKGSAMMDIVDAREFQKLVFESKGLVVVDIWAEWCPPCIAFSRVLAEVSAEMDNIQFMKFNYDFDKVFAGAYLGVRAVPTVIIFKDGVEVERQARFMNKDEFKDWISNFV
jgi:thioredoxin 1